MSASGLGPCITTSPALRREWSIRREVASAILDDRQWNEAGTSWSTPEGPGARG